MRAISLFFATIAIGASALLHAWLFAPFTPTPAPVPVPPLVHDDDPPPPKANPGIAIDVTEPPAAPGARPAPDGPSEPGGERALGEPREDLVVEFDVQDEHAVLALADALDLPLVLVAEQTQETWPVRVDGSGRLTVGERGHAERDKPPTKVFLVLPDRDPGGRQNRFGHWGLLARSMLRIPPAVATQLALALRDDTLHRVAHATLRAHCVAKGIALPSVRQVMVRPVLHDGIAQLAVSSLIVK